MSNNINNYNWVQPSGTYQGNQHGPPSMMPQHGHQQPPYRFNINANTFVPRQSNYRPMPQQSMQSNMQQYKSYEPTTPYSNVQMYGAPPPQQQFYDYARNPHNQMTAYYDESSVYDQFGFPQQQQYIASAALREMIQKSPNCAEILEILVGLEQLLPGGEDFNSWAIAVKDRLILKKMGIEAKQIAIQIACEMAINVSPPAHPFGSHNDYQAQYTMARLLAYLASEIPELMGQAILPSLEQAHTNQSKNNLQLKSNLLMFFADLFTRLESDIVQEVAGKRLKPLAESVISQMKDFLNPVSDVSDETMKLLLQVLKLAGRDLDSISTAYDQMNMVLSTLMGLAKGHPKLSENMKAQIKDLIEQRNKGWGQVSNKNTPSVYCPDGSLLELNDDESRFLEECLAAGESSSREANTDPSDTSLDEADVMNEFDSFMKEEALMERTMNMIEDLTVEEDDRQRTPVADEPPAATPPKKEEEASEETVKSS